MKRSNYDASTCEEAYRTILLYIDRMEEKYGYESLSSQIPTGITITDEVAETLPPEVNTFRNLNRLECALAGEEGHLSDALSKEVSTLLQAADAILG